MKAMARFARTTAVLVVAASALVAGTARADGPFSYYPLTPCRVADTRNAAGTNGGPILSAGVTRNFQVQGVCGVPVGAKAVSLNLTIVAPSAGSWLTVWPSGGTAPFVSAINFAAGDPPTANGAIVGLSANAQDLSIKNAVGTVHVIVDVTGYFQ